MKKTILILFLIFIVISAAFAIIQIGNKKEANKMQNNGDIIKSETDQKNNTDKNKIVCTMIYDPVCGKDNKTYSNQCTAEASDVGIAYRGECNTDNKPNCKNLWWYDANNKGCQQKQFCGVYMYQGLRTFESMKDCEENLAKNYPIACQTDSNCPPPTSQELTNSVGLSARCVDGFCKMVQMPSPNTTNNQ